MKFHEAEWVGLFALCKGKLYYFSPRRGVWQRKVPPPAKAKLPTGTAP